MRRKQQQTLIAIGVLAVPSLAAMMLSWFSSRIGDRPFEQGQIWFAAAAFVASAWSVIALVWTLQEQRKLTQSVSRSYLEVQSARGTVEDQAGLVLEMEIVNVGQTPAFDIRIVGNVTYIPENEWGPAHEETKVALSNRLTGSLEYIPAKSVYFLHVHGGEGYPLPPYEAPTAWRYIGPSFSIDAKLVYRDAFGDRQELSLQLAGSDLSFDQFTSGFDLQGTHSSLKKQATIFSVTAGPNT